MQKTAIFTDLSHNDRNVIESIALGTPLLLEAAINLKFYIKDITQNHLLYLGWAIGQIQATEKTLENFHQTQNPLSKCRVN